MTTYTDVQHGDIVDGTIAAYGNPLRLTKQEILDAWTIAGDYPEGERGEVMQNLMTQHDASTINTRHTLGDAFSLVCVRGDRGKHEILITGSLEMVKRYGDLTNGTNFFKADASLFAIDLRACCRVHTWR